MRSSIYDFFELILISFLNLILDSVYKGSGLFKAVMEEDLELFLYDRPSNYAHNLLLILMPMV